MTADEMRATLVLLDWEPVDEPAGVGFMKGEIRCLYNFTLHRAVVHRAAPVSNYKTYLLPQPRVLSNYLLGVVVDQMYEEHLL